MIRKLFSQLEQKVGHALDVIELLRLQIEELEEENALLRSEQEQWRDDLVNLVQRFDQMGEPPTTARALNETPHKEPNLA
jgi:cell division protein ZapB